MDKIKLSELQKVEKYRKIVDYKQNGKVRKIYVENPVGEKADLIFDVVTGILDKGEYKKNDLIVTDDNITEFLLDLLTNIDIDEKRLTDSLDFDISLVEVYSALYEIHNEFIVRVCAGITILWEEERKNLYRDRMINSFETYQNEKEIMETVNKEE